MSSQIKQYCVITGNYWAYTLTDGALRMLVVLYFHQLGYSALEVAMLFIFYEVFGVITNLVGGYIGARAGLNVTMNIGLAIQILALAMLLVPTEALTVVWVMTAQAMSGIAKDLNKMSAKSSIKSLMPEGENQRLFKWVALLTGSKNTLKGVGFFLGGLLLTNLGFHNAILSMLIGLVIVLCLSLALLKKDENKPAFKPKFSQIFSKSEQINILSSARFFLFGARDVWFVVALPVYLSQTVGWQYSSVGAFFAVWVIIYGLIQSLAPSILQTLSKSNQRYTHLSFWAFLLALITALISGSLIFNFQIQTTLITGLIIFGCVFAINSSLHSYLIVKLAKSDNVSMDVGFYYMANAGGRLLGTILSGVLFQLYGLAACLIASTIMLVAATILPRNLSLFEKNEHKNMQTRNRALS